jgi:NADPH:quinone reductase-like Zn-dependent oxidoreductase
MACLWGRGRDRHRAAASRTALPGRRNRRWIHAVSRDVKAIIFSEYGGPDVLAFSEVPVPGVGPDIVLIRTRAAGVNPAECKAREGAVAAIFPTHFPVIPGWDVAGVVEAVGVGVHEYEVGDELIGYVRRDHLQYGTYAEFVPAPIRTVARKPPGLSWAEAAGLPLVGLTAYQALMRANVRLADTVLIHAAAGGVGSVAVQLAGIAGARVIGTASEHNHDYLRELGAEPVVYGDGLVDRVRALAPAGVDVALDFVGGDSIRSSAELVRDRRRIVSIADPGGVISAGGSYVDVRPDAEQLATLARYAAERRLRIHVERVFPLSEAAAAQRLVQSGHGRGKVVLAMGSS